MTARELLSSNVRRARLLSLSGIMFVACALTAMTVMWGALSITHQIPFLVTLGMLGTGFALILGGHVALSTVRCPWCAGELGWLAYRRHSVSHVKTCLHCGKSLDDALAANGKPKTASWTLGTSRDDGLA